MGKRMDHSARLVSASGPEYRADECGIYKVVLSEILSPFIIRELMLRGETDSVKQTIVKVRNMEYDISILEDICKRTPLLINRAPSLHQYSIQAIYARPIDEPVIKMNHMICHAMNNDNDGDAILVMAPLSEEAISEIKHKLMYNNLVNVSNGEVLVKPFKDAKLGIYLLSTFGEGSNKVVNTCSYS